MLSLANPNGVIVSPDGQNIYVAAMDGQVTSGAINQFAPMAKASTAVQSSWVRMSRECISALGRARLIHGTVYNDINSNGLRDASLNEFGLAGVTVQLVKNNTVIAETTTDGLGDYRFANIPAATTYTVQLYFIDPQNHLVTYPTQSNNGKWTIALSPAQTHSGTDFLVNNFGSAASQVSGLVFRDTNGNGATRVSSCWRIARYTWMLTTMAYTTQPST